MNHQAKCIAARFILGGEIRIRTNTQKQTVNDTKRYIHALPIGGQGWG